MYLYEVKDIVREHFGRTGIPTSLLNLAIKEARRSIEREGNWWWMRQETDFTLTVDLGHYDVQSGVINLPNFKDARALHWRESGDTDWAPVELGNTCKTDLDLLYETDDTGEPEAAVIENETLYLYPPLPDLAYEMHLYYYEWTSNPDEGNTGTDDLLNFFGMAVVYASLIWGYEIELKDLEGAKYWRSLFAAELKQIKRENFKRDWKEDIVLVPRAGRDRLRRWQLVNRNLWQYGR